MELWVRIASLVVGLLGVALAVIQTIRVYKAKKAAGEDVNLLDVVLDNLLPSMEEAELTTMDGKAKKMYVKSNLLLVCNALNIPYNDDLFNKVIERLIDFSKSVNASETETTETAQQEKTNLGYGQVK